MTPSPEEVAALVERLKIWSTRDKKVFPEHSTGDFLGRTADALTAQAARIAELERECAELRKDKARLDWLQFKATWHDPENRLKVIFPIETVSFTSLRKCIDAAMTAKPTEARK